jgi:hypothetical protein
VPGGDSWFNSNNVASTLVLAKGGAGGQSIVNTNVDTFGTGGAGTTSGSIGNLLFAGGSGATSTSTSFGGGGGGSAGTSSAGNAPASTTNGLGAVAVTGGGNGGNANASAGSSGDGQSPTGSPGGGGGGARAASTTQRYGGTGASGQLILTIQAIAKADQSITFGALSNKTYGDASFTLTATASSGLAITYTSSDPSVASILGSTVTILKAGSTTITAIQSGNDNYSATPSVAQILTVSATSGTTFGTWSGNSTLNSELVYKYAFGAANMTSVTKEMTSSITPTTLSLTAVVRTDDRKLVITPKSVSSLSGTWSAADPVISVIDADAAEQIGLGAGLVRKVYSVERGIDSKRFLKLEAVYTP